MMSNKTLKKKIKFKYLLNYFMFKIRFMLLGLFERKENKQVNITENLISLNK